MFNYLLIFIISIAISFSNNIRPSNGSFLTYIYVPFEWAQEPDAIEYNLQIINNDQVILDIHEESTVYIDTENLDWNNTYYWKVRPLYEDGSYGDWNSFSYFNIGTKQFPEIQADILNEALTQDGLVAFGGFAPELSTAIIDQSGEEVWNTGIPNDPEVGVYGIDFILNHINEFGNIYGLSTFDYPNNTGSKINYDLDIVWSAPTTDPQYPVDIHEIKQIPNGNYMAFVPDFRLGPIPIGNWTFLYQSIGYVADGITEEYPWIGMRIVEWDEDGNEVWNWDPFQYFSMDHSDLYGGQWWDLNAQAHDWMHSNAFHFDDEESVIYVSHRHLSRISKIAYPSGEVIWNIGMPEQYSTGDDNICTDLGNSYQHNIQLLDDGTLLFFDNGNLSQMLMNDSNPTSRIRRIRVIDNSYCETVWDYELPPNLFGLGMGSVQLLDNGNYFLYTFGSGMNEGEPTLREVTSDYEVVWNYQGINYAAWYRSYKIPSMHPDVFSVVADNFISSDNNETSIFVSNNEINFRIYNKSGYAQPYNYVLSDLIDGGGPQMFAYEEGEFYLEPYETTDLSFQVSNANLESSAISLSIWPTHHKYALKDLFFDIESNGVLTGDLNYDNLVNILDVVILVNMIISSEIFEDNADLNQDNEINVLDIVLLVNLILG